MNYMLNTSTCAPDTAARVSAEVEAKAQGAAEPIMVATICPLMVFPDGWWICCKVGEPLQLNAPGHYRSVKPGLHMQCLDL